MLDVLIQARDRGLFNAVTDCGAGGFSSAVGEMGEEVGAEVWLEKAPLKYEGLTYTEIWISEAQERMVIFVPPEKLDEALKVFADEDVEATVIRKPPMPILADPAASVVGGLGLLPAAQRLGLSRGRPRSGSSRTSRSRPKCMFTRSAGTATASALPATRSRPGTTAWPTG